MFLTINQAPRAESGPKTQITASWQKVAEFLYECSVTMIILKTVKKPVLQFCYSLTIFLHRITGLNLKRETSERIYDRLTSDVTQVTRFPFFLRTG